MLTKIEIILKYFLFIILMIFIFWKFHGKNDAILIGSPNDKILVQIIKEENGVFYKVILDNQEIISKSRLGLFFNDKNHFPGVNIIKDVKKRYYDNTWEMPLGEVRNVKNTYNETSISFKDFENNETGKIRFRVYNDGVAFRYLLNQLSDENDSVIVTDEVTQFNLSEDAISWWTPAYTENRYEHLFNKSKV